MALGTDVTKSNFFIHKVIFSLPSFFNFRGLVRELCSRQLMCFQMQNLKKKSVEDYMKQFLETRVKPVWPVGWMETSVLMAEVQWNKTKYDI